MAYDVVILPSFAQVEAWCKGHADERASGLFSQTVSTFDAWVADLWELHGDGRLPVSAMQRELLMKAVLSSGCDVAEAPGLAPLAAKLAREASGLPEYEKAIEAAREGRPIEGVSEREAALLCALAEYDATLESLGLVELGEAVAQLTRRSGEVFPRKTSVLVHDVVALTPIESHFLSACENLDASVEYALGREGVPGAPKGVSVRYAFPSGRLAQPGLIADEAVACAADGDVVVACKDPLAQFEATCERLADQGLNVCVQARKPFAQTDFGRAYLAMFRCLHSDPWDRAALTDALASPFSGVSANEAFNVDKTVRADRVLGREDALAGLRAQSEPFSQLEELASDPDADVLIGVFEQMAQSMAGRTASWRAEQLAAMGALREATTAARKVGVGIRACAVALERATVPVSAQVEGSGPAVVFATQAGAARMRPGCCQSLVIADLTSEDYPVSNRDDAATTLMGKLGIPLEEGALAQARCDFSALCQLPVRTLVIMRPLGDDAAEPTYPAAVLEEFVDACCADAAEGEMDDTYRIPSGARPGLVERGEESLYANARAKEPGAVQAPSSVIARPRIDDMSPRAAGSVMPARHDGQGRAIEKPRPSPSHIEAYLECPYQWFATRRLRIEELDEGFGPLERGNFAHAALEGFYQRSQALGHMKVTPENLGAAQALMNEVAGEIAQAQFSQAPKGGRLVAATELERREVSALIDQLVAYLEFEAELLPTFHPAYFEYEIPAERPVEYAGYALVGKVDRIDVDDRGHAVIVDYKGSVNAEHDIVGKDFGHVGKVQTRIYAQAVKRALGLDVVGALYVSYGRAPSVTGAYDPRVIEAAHLPGANADKCACGLRGELPDESSGEFPFADLAFDVMLDATEHIAARAIAGMCAGDVSCNPSTREACTWCPVLVCPKRGA